MAVTRFSQRLIDKLVAQLWDQKRPRTQEDCCAIGAHISVLADDGPWTDEHVLEVAAEMARGLFGEAFEAADFGQRSAWIDMCERELRKAIV